ncbi:S8 family serine peptidase [Paenibacillus sp. FSL W8-1187]|uniref:Glycoside hydrolase, family 16:S-layer protein: Carbohydrate-binding, CenC-like n=1 Tax=Paenibacillus pasadenensis TaxID=217090 RepID=A0A2N5N120_9BACL|nr:S8 family serine peptidase [Paenibacillus pasadenensis]PLT44038.1 Glycoside hydrolase, family 16:S-layer protein: Carbohydrate-binding, CenC-like precursor [Paenibacillus pasadenensis]
MHNSKRKAISKALSATLTAALVLTPFASTAAAAEPAVTPGILAGSLSKGLQPLISPRLDTTSSERIKVIVQLDGASISEGKYAAKMGVKSLSAEATEASISGQQSRFISQAQKLGISLDVSYQFDTVLNGMEIELPANQIPKLASLSGVKSVYENRTFYSIPDTSPTPLGADPADCKCDISPLTQIGAPDAWAKGITGKGIKVGVIDTGVDYLHPDLKDAYAGGHDSYFNDDDPYEEIPDAKSGNTGTSHGTHVSGTIASREANETEYSQKGVAYESELHVYKVLGFNYETGRSSGSSAQVIDGIEHAVEDGMDVINLSLGSDDAKDAFTPDAIALNNAVLAGVVAVVANGNNAEDSEQHFYSMGSPASSQLSISVGAATSPSATYGAEVTASVYRKDSLETVTGSVYDLDLPIVSWMIKHNDFASDIGTGPQEAIYVNLGAEKDYKDKDVKDKIVLVSRGSTTFVDKFLQARKHGAKAVVIFNGKDDLKGNADLSESIPDRDGEIGNFYGDGFTVPVLDLDGKTGRALARFATASGNSNVWFDFAKYTSEQDPGDRMAGFSSRGPNADGILGIKPDVVAPGVAVMSTWPAYGKGIPGASYDEAYSRSSGTSMATPHVAGLAALLQQAHPEWTPFDIRAALANTADPISDEDGIRYDVYSQGAGRVNVAKALETPALLQTVEQLTLYDVNMNPVPTTNYGDNASFGVMAAGSAEKSITLQLNNVSDKALTYTASYELHTSVTSDPANPIATPDTSKIQVSFGGLTGQTVTANAYSKQPFSLSVKPAADAEAGVYEGSVVLKSAGHPDLHIPFVVHVGDKTPDTGYGIQDVALTSRQLSPNGDGVNDSIELSFRLAAEGMNYYEVAISDINDDTIGYLNVTDATGSAKALEKKTYKHSFNGIYSLDADYEDVDGALKDGSYAFTIVAAKIANGKVAAQTLGYIPFSVVNSNYSTGGGGGGFPGPIVAPSPTPTPAPAAAGEALKAIAAQGLAQTTVKSTTASESAATVTTVTYADLQAAIGTGSVKLALVVNAAAESGKASKLSLPADQLQLLGTAPAGSALYLNTGKESLELPLSVLASVPAGSGLELIIRSAADEASKFSGATVLGTPVAFEANVVSASGSVPLNVPSKTFLKRSFTLDKGVSAEKAGVLFLAGGKQAPAPAVFTTHEDGTTTVVVSRPGFSTYAAASGGAAFTDIAGSWAQSRIQSLSDKLLLNGTAAGAFTPKASVTRAEFAAMLTRGLGLTTTSKAPFTDLASGAWYTDAVSAAYAAGLINGYADGTFRPNGIISRQELAVMLAKAADLAGAKSDSGKFTTYSDAGKFGAFAKDSIAAVTASGLMEGSAGAFDPLGSTTREAAATVLHKLLSGAKLI